jgi:predicted amidohydrolase YtcJ
VAGDGVVWMLIRNARLWPSPSIKAALDVRIAAGRVVECEPGLRPDAGEEEINAAGCALLPGLHDHHVHLRALAAARVSVQVGPGQVRSAAEFSARLREADAAAPPGAWLRCVGYHESVAGPLDRWALDRLVADLGPDPARLGRQARPVRVQHRTGALWVVNSAAAAALGLDDGDDLAGIERDAGGRATGRLWRLDRWLADRVPARTAEAADGLASVSARAASLGVTGFTDATPGATGVDVAGLAAACADGTIAQRLHCMAAADASAASVSGAARGRFSIGPVKIMLDDDTLPSLDSLADSVRSAHAAGQAVAVHCVTRVQLVLTLAALDVAGRLPGDRIEHGAVIPAELVPALRGLTIVSQPHFVAERGEQYLRDVAPEDLPDLWRLRSLIDAGVGVAAGSDAPFGGADPWPVIRAATRRPADLGPREAVDPETAIRLFLGSPTAPARLRTVAPGAPADLVLLRCPPSEAFRSLTSDLIAATFVDGALVYRDGSG